MKLDYLLQKGYKGYIKTCDNTERARIQDYLRSCGYSQLTIGVIRDIEIIYIFVPYTSDHLTYSQSVDNTNLYIKYADITQEVYQLAGLSPTPYEYW